MATLHRLDACTINSTVIKSIVNSAVAGNVSVLKSMGSGDLAPLFVGHATQNPELRFTTNDLTGVLVTAAVPAEGLALSATTYQYWKLVPEAGRTARSAESHITCAVAKGTCYWDSINLPQNGLGTISVVHAASYDGTNAPIVIAGSQALDSTELAATTYFGAGPIQINGALVSEIQDVTIANNVTAQPLYIDSVSWPVGVYLQSIQPTITITTKDMTKLTSLGIVGGALNGSTGLAVYGRKFVNNAASGAQRVAAATAEHLKIVFPSGTYRVESADAANSEDATVQIIVDAAAATSATALMTAVVNSAIPTS